MQLWQLRKTAEHQTRNLAKLLRGQKLNGTPLGGMTLDVDDIAVARRWLENRSSWCDRDQVRSYESKFAHWNGSRHAFAFMGGRVALSACIHALGFQPGDEVIIPGYTCVVVPNAFKYAGVRIVYSDIELDTYGLDVEVLEQRITPKTRGVLLQHMYGLVSRDYEAILELVRRHDLKLIEDCAHSIGAQFNGLNVGNRGDIAFYSSEQSKVFNTIQGGVATTNDGLLAAKLAQFQDAAPDPGRDLIEQQLYNVLLQYYEDKHSRRWIAGDLAEMAYGSRRIVSTTPDEERGVRPPHYGCRMPAPIAALGINQLRKINLYNESRRRTARRWDQWCHAAGYSQAVVIRGSLPVFLRYPILVEPEKKRDTSALARELGVEVGVWFKSKIHPAPDAEVTECPNADQAVARCINLPTLS